MITFIIKASPLLKCHLMLSRTNQYNKTVFLSFVTQLTYYSNPIEESDRLWTLGVCNALRRLTLKGSPIADDINYRSVVASALPMLNVLDERPLNADEEEYITEIDSDSDASDLEVATSPTLLDMEKHVEESQVGPSTSQDFDVESEPEKLQLPSSMKWRRPATTECGGHRPARPDLPRRPRTALERTIDGNTRLQIMNTLMDDEWCGSGSKLTSHSAVCGNIARALRRPEKNKLNNSVEAELHLVAQSMEAARRASVAEIPRERDNTQWDRFRIETGIDIDIDFSKRPNDADPSEVLDRIEKIEKETMERLNHPEDVPTYSSFVSDPSRLFSRKIVDDYELWKQLEDLTLPSDPPRSVDELFKNIVAEN